MPPKAIMFQVLCPQMGLNKPRVIEEFLAELRPSGGYWVTNETVMAMSLPDTYRDGRLNTRDEILEFFRKFGGIVRNEEVIEA